MSEFARPTVDNRLIAALPRTERERLLDDCDVTRITFGQVLCEPNAPMPFAYFPLDGFVSLFVTVVGHPPMEVGLIGDEGMLGSNIVLGVAKHSETEEELVVYRTDYGDRSLWVRPLVMFQETVEIDGQPRPRFLHIGPE